MADRDPMRVKLDELIVRFWQRGITPLVSTNGRHPSADIEITKVPAKDVQSKEHLAQLISVDITAHGQERLDAVGG